MDKTNEKEYLYSYEEEAVRGNAESIKEIIKLMHETSNITELKIYAEMIDMHTDNIIREIDRMAEV